VVPIDEEVDPSAETVALPEQQAPKEKPGAEQEVARPGMTIGNYEIIEEIARGAVGVVYRARQKSLNRVVALKILLAGQAASEEQVQRFRQEALAVAKLRHPNIVPVYDVGVFEGKHYIAMEYVDGRPLHHLLKGPRLTPNQALDIILKVADAIYHAHKHGIIHRDIKPANIMVDDTGRVQVMDFGLAKEIEADAQFTRSGTTMGTPNYMPIEQAQGDNKNIDERSDIYSLGAVLYEMLTGVPPFVAETNLKTILKVINEEPLPPRKRNPYIHRDVETICIKAMEKDKTRRYDTVQTFMDDIERFKSGEPILARPPSTAYRISTKIRKHAAVISASLGTIIVAILVITLYNVIFPPSTPPSNPGTPNGGITEPTPPSKTHLIYELAFAPDKKAAALEQADKREVYLTDQGLAPKLPEGQLPEQILVSQDVMVKPDASGSLSLCLYARTDTPTFDNYYTGLVATLQFANGALHQVVFKGNERFTMAVSPALQPRDGVFHLLLWRERKDQDKLYVSVNGRIIQWKIDGMPAKAGNGIGIALSGKGIDFGPVALREVVPPWETIVKTADELFKSNTAYAAARKAYEKAVSEYVADPASKIPRAELARVQLNIAICLTNESGLYSGGKIKPGQFDAAVTALKNVLDNYAKTVPAVAETAEVYLFHISLVEDWDLQKAKALLQKYPDLKMEDIIKTIFSKFPAADLMNIAKQKSTSTDDLAKVADHFFEKGNLEGASEVLLLLADRYQELGQYDKSQAQLDRIISGIDFSPQPDIGTYYQKIAAIRQTKLYLLAGNFSKYDWATNSLLSRYQKRVPGGDGYVFDADLAQLKVEWGKRLFEHWLAKPNRVKTDDDLGRAYAILSECLDYSEPIVPLKPPLAASAPPEKTAPGPGELEHAFWQLTISSASAELVRVSYALDRPAAEITQHFERFKGGSRELDAVLLEIASRVYSRAGEFTRAQRLAYEIINNYSDLKSTALNAINTLAETHVLQGIDRNGDPLKINIKELDKAIASGDAIVTSDRKDAETRIDGKLKAVFVELAVFNRYGWKRGPDGQPLLDDNNNPIVTEVGTATAADLQTRWNDIKTLIDAAGLETGSYAAQIHRLLAPGTTPNYDDYARMMQLEKDPRKRAEMKFAAGMRLQFEKDPLRVERGKQLLRELCDDDDPLREYWFTRFLDEYLKEKHEQTPPISDKT
jgi:serine/threonine protein kinase/tetratricopeptide (TPR) repeat protein